MYYSNEYYSVARTHRSVQRYYENPQPELYYPAPYFHNDSVKFMPRRRIVEVNIAHSPINQLGNQLFNRAAALGVAHDLGRMLRSRVSESRLAFRFRHCDGEAGHPGYNIIRQHYGGHVVYFD